MAAARWGVVLYDFEGSPEQHTMTVFRNDVVKIKQVTEEQWWLAEAGGKAGYIPRLFVGLKPPEWAPHRGNRDSGLSQASAGMQAAGNTNTTDTFGQEDEDLEDEDEDGEDAPPQQSSTPQKQWVPAVALYAFDKTHVKHLAMAKKDRILVVRPADSAQPWLEAKLGDDVGIVPANRVYILGPGEDEPPQWKADRKNKRRDVAASSVAPPPPAPASHADWDIPPPPAEPGPPDSPAPPANSTARKQPQQSTLSHKTLEGPHDEASDPKMQKLLQRRAALTGNVPMHRLSVFANVPASSHDGGAPSGVSAPGHGGAQGPSSTSASSHPSATPNNTAAHHTSSDPTAGGGSGSGVRASPHHHLHSPSPNHARNGGIRDVPAFAALFALHRGLPPDSRVDAGQVDSQLSKDDLDAAAGDPQSGARDRDRTRSHAGSVMGFFRKRGPSVTNTTTTSSNNISPGGGGEGRSRDAPSSSFNSFVTHHSAASATPQVPADDVKLLEKQVRFHVFQDATVLFVEGSTDVSGRCMYVILEGSVDVAVAGEPYGSLGPGQVFGAEALVVEHSRRPFTATTARGTLTVLIAITAWGYATLCKQLPWYEDAVRSLVTARSGSQLSRLALFHKLDAKSLDYLGMRFTFKMLKKGEPVDTDALSLLVLGSVSLSSVFGDGTKRELRRLGPGQFIGEGSIASTSMHTVDGTEASLTSGNVGGGGGGAATRGGLSLTSSGAAGGGGAAMVVSSALESTVILTLHREDLALYASMEPRIRAEAGRIAKFRSADLISLIPFFSDIVPPGKRAILASAFDFIVNREGEEVYAMGRVARCMYLVCDGEVEIQDERGETVRTLKQGAVFGEAALAVTRAGKSSAGGGGAGGGVAGAEYRMETAIALGPGTTVCVALPKDGFDRFVEYAPDIGSRLRASVEQAAQLALAAADGTGQGDGSGPGGAGGANSVPAKSSYIPTSADELSCASCIPPEFLKETEVRAALDTFADIGRAMAPCLKMLNGFPQYMHPVPFDIGRDPQKLFVVSIVKLDDKMDLIKLPASLAMTVGELVNAVFDKAGHSGLLDPATRDYFGLKVAARADYLVDRDVELARYKCVTAALRRGLDRGELKFALVDLRSNPKHGPGLRTMLRRNESSTSTFAGAPGSGENTLMEAIALYDFDGGPGNISFRAGDRLEVEARLGEPMWPVSLMGSTVSGVAPQNFIKAVAPILGPVMAPSQKKRMGGGGGGGVQPTGFGGGVSTGQPVDLPGLPAMSLEVFAKAIADGTQKVERLAPPWGSVVDQAVQQQGGAGGVARPLPSANTSKVAPWPLRVRLRGIERLFMLPEIERCLYVQVRLELVFGGQVLETKLSRKLKRNSTLRFEDEWFWFSRFVCDINYSTRVCFTLLGLDATKKTVDRDMSTLDAGEGPNNGGNEGDGVGGSGGGGGGPRRMESTQTIQSASGGPGTTTASEMTDSTKKSGGLRGRLFGGGRKTTAVNQEKLRAHQGSKLLDVDPDLGEDAVRTGETLNLAGAAVQLWGPDLSLRTGKMALGMWPKAQGERLLYCAENYDPDAARLLVEFDKYAEPIRFNMPPFVSLKVKTLGDMLPGNSNPRALQQLQLQEDSPGGGGGRGKLEKQGSNKGIGAMFTPLTGGGGRKVPLQGSGASPSSPSQPQQLQQQQQQQSFAAASNRRKSVSVFAQRGGQASASSRPTGVATAQPDVKKEPSKPVMQLLARDPLQLYQMTDIEKSLIWTERELLVDNPFALSKCMLAVNWLNHSQRDQALKLLERWSVPSPMQALELLDGRFGEYRLREFAVKCLEAFDDEELADFLIQLIQGLKYEIHHDNPLARFLLRRALANPREIGTKLYWGLRAEMHVKAFAPRFGLLLKAYLRACDSHFAELAQQHDAQELLKHVAKAAQRKESKAERTALAQTAIAQINERMPRMFQLALDPRMRASRFNPNKCRIMSSKKRPLWLELECVDPVEAGGEPMLVMFKVGDDLRQDQMTLQILRVLDQIWLAEGMNLKLSPYQCLATGDEMGMLEIVPDSETIAMIETSQGGTMGSLRQQPIRDFLELHNRGGTIDQAVDNFVRSCAGYCVATYVMGIGDRHNDNILCCRDGRLFHIDFGHVLGNFKTVAALGGFKRERTPFVFTQGMAYAMGGKESPDYKRFVELSCKAFNVIRLHADELVTMFRLMVPAGMPELQSDSDIQYLVDMLHLGKSDAEAAEIFKSEINSAKADLYRRVDNFLHTLKHS